MVGRRSEPDDGAMVGHPPPPTPSGKPVRLRTAPRAVVAAFVLILSTPVVVWWVFGNQDDRVPGLDPAHDQHAFSRTFDPPAISAGTELMIGLIATVVLVAAALTLVSATRSGRLDRRWWPPIVGCVGLGASRHRRTHTDRCNDRGEHRCRHAGALRHADGRIPCRRICGVDGPSVLFHVDRTPRVTPHRRKLAVTGGDGTWPIANKGYVRCC